MPEVLDPTRITIGTEGVMVLVYEAALETLANIEQQVAERAKHGEPPEVAYQLVINRAKGRLAWLKGKAGKADENSQPFIFIQCGCGNGTVLTTGEGERRCEVCGVEIAVKVSGLRSRDGDAT